MTLGSMALMIFEQFEPVRDTDRDCGLLVTLASSRALLVRSPSFFSAYSSRRE